MLESAVTRPRTCGIAMSIVAMFCYIPGLVMTFSILSRGFTNTAALGLVFIVIAVFLSIVAVAMCVKSHRNAKRYKKFNSRCLYVTPSNLMPESPTANGKSGEERDTSVLLPVQKTYYCVDNHPSNAECQKPERSSYQHFLLSKQVSQSYVLRRYFDNLYSPSGPFALNQEQMDRMNQEAIRKSQRFFQGVPRHKSFPNLDHAESMDSAIGTDSSNPSTEKLFVA